MATQVVMPKLSPTMEEGQLTRWLKKEGDKVSMGEPLAEIDTDKATMEMQALSSGTLRKIIVQEGETAPLGQPIAIIGEPDEDISELLDKAKGRTGTAEEDGGAAAKAEAKEEKEKPEDEEKKEKRAVKAKAEEKEEGEERAAPAVSPDGKKAAAPSPGEGRKLVSPIAARMAAEAGVNLGSVKGSGPGGR